MDAQNKNLLNYNILPFYGYRTAFHNASDAFTQSFFQCADDSMRARVCVHGICVHGVRMQGRSTDAGGRSTDAGTFHGCRDVPRMGGRSTDAGTFHGFARTFHGCGDVPRICTDVPRMRGRSTERPYGIIMTTHFYR